MVDILGEMSKFIGWSTHIQQPVAAKLYRKSYSELLNAAAVMNFDIFPYDVK